jgi:gas vesicle structural protein
MSNPQYQRPVLSLYDLLDRVLDKGMVIDANVSVSLIGIEILVVRARIVVASIDTWLRYAAAMGLAAPMPELTTPRSSPQARER